MAINRRRFLAATLATAAIPVTASERKESEAEAVGCLVDTTLCIGCRQCERACARSNQLPNSDVEPLIAGGPMRRPDADRFTVVNAYLGSPSLDQRNKPRTYVKTQCMHCLDPACVSACIVGALSKISDGAVVYNPSICIGCRYCMVACPFQIPAYEYDEALDPRVRKCEFCADRAAGTGANPACAAACPTEAIVFGRRTELLAMAHHRIEQRPARYINQVYGEHEIGGTSWLYLMGRPQEEIGLPALPDNAPPRVTEAIQHTIFRYGAIPIGFYAFLGALMWFSQHRPKNETPPEEQP